MTVFESLYYTLLFGYVSIGLGHYTYKVITCLKRMNELKPSIDYA